MPPVALALAAVFCIACGQILFKMTAERISGLSLSQILADRTTLAIFGTSMVIYAGATVLWVMALRDLTLAHGYMLMTLSFVLVPLAAAVFFGEQLSWGFFAGLALIIAGLFLILGTRA